MSAAQHSPGPWRSRKGNRGTTEIFDESGRLIVGNALVMNEEANVRLIAAAPDGLDAAREALIALVAAPDSVAVQIARRKLNAFIAKATGEAS